MPKLRELIVKRAEELPEETRNALKVNNNELVEIRLFTNSPKISASSKKVIKGRFSKRLVVLLDEEGLLR